jgi:hypothetical protein
MASTPMSGHRSFRVWIARGLTSPSNALPPTGLAPASPARHAWALVVVELRGEGLPSRSI